ncbi:MAG: TPM domain-containing protein [Candidatus Spechtbacteria bacterium]|nr:TPM domain-containing protein [Candidatus Spechtbacteria bacterium]
MKSKVFVLALALVAILAILVPASLHAEGEEEEQEEKQGIRGIYIYDERDFLPADSKLALAWYLWNIDLKTRYEIVLVFPKTKFSETEIIDWFNTQGVGKKKKDTGAALFVFPDNSIFVAIGSGNDKVTVTKSKTYGEKIFADFTDDPVLTTLRFLTKIGGDINKSTLSEMVGNAGKTLWENIDIVLLWALFLALILFLVQQYNGFQATDFILPALVFVVAMIAVGISAIGSSSEAKSYTSYGMITSTAKSSYHWVHLHTICTSTGKTTICHNIPHTHTMYTNDVRLTSYELNTYRYRFSSDESKAAWRHEVGEVDWLKVGIEKGELRGAGRAKADGSGGITKGDGVWIHAATKKK